MIVYPFSVDNVTYMGRTSTLTLLNNNADTSAIYEPVKADERRNTYEDPEMSVVKYYNDKLVRRHVHNRMEKYD